MKKHSLSKVFSVVLAVVLLMTSLCFPSLAAPSSGIDKAPSIPEEQPLRLSVASDATAVTPYAEQHLTTMKAVLSDNTEAIGFTQSELLSMKIGNPFSIYVFDEELTLTKNDVLVFPLLSFDKIIGIMEAVHDAASDTYSFTFGKAYAEELNSLRYQRVFNATSNLIIGRMGNKLFACDEEEIVIFLDRDVALSSSASDLRNVSSSILTAQAETNFVDVTTAIGGTELKSTPPGYTSTTPATRFPNPLPIPHVDQTGVCGVAAWAAVLNYRFYPVAYTNASLATEMQDDGYWNYTDPVTGDTRPTMTDYRDYANYNHAANSVYASSISIATTKSCINSGRPVMGNWWTGTNPNKDWHAIVITGYQDIQIPPNIVILTYNVKNPWYTDQQVIVVSGSSVVYTNAGITWTLSDAVY